MDPHPVSQEGRRERKRRETHQRITEIGIRLFTENGYDATTLDAIAAAAGIARRTFFHYFGSKEDIILAWQGALPEALRAAILAQDTAASPLAMVERGLIALTADMHPEAAVTISTIVRSNAQLQAGNQAKFLRMEQAACEALCTLWPDHARRCEMRVAAMTGVGVMRLSIDAWSMAGGTRPLAAYLEETFACLKAGFGPP